QFIADDKDADGDHVGFKLGNNGDNLILYAVDRTNVIDRFNFTGQAQANGVSFGRLPDGSTNVVFFAAGRSTPGASNFQLLMSIIFNEVLTHTDPPLEDAIELYNPTLNPVDIGGWFLSNDKSDFKKFRIPNGTSIPGRNYKVFYEYQFNPTNGSSVPFTFNSAHGDKAYLSQGDTLGNLTGYRAKITFDAAANGVSFGRYTNSVGKVDYPPMSARSFGVDNPATVDAFRTGLGLVNPYPLVGPIVI